MTTSVLRRTIIAAAAFAVTAALVPVAPAQAAGGVVAAPNGMVGVQQNIVVNAPGIRNQTVDVAATLGPYVHTFSVTIDANGIGSLAWTPAGAGTWSISAAGLSSSQFSVAPMATTTQLITNSQIQAGGGADAVAVVRAAFGSTTPQGTVVLTGAWHPDVVLATGVLKATTDPLQSTAAIDWRPSDSEVFMPVKATYIPSSGGQLSSYSPWITTLLVPRVTVALRIPQVLRVGQATSIEAVLGQGMPDGSVAFSVGEDIFSPSIGTAYGKASFFFTPTTKGFMPITVKYSSGHNFSGTTVQGVWVDPPLPVDVVTVQPVGQAPWVGNAPPLRVGKSISLAGSTTSGAPVLFNVTGPCAISGAVLTALDAGQCTITATSPGNSGYLANTASFPLTVTAAPRR